MTVSDHAKMIREHDIVELITSVPDERLMAGDKGTIVHIYKGGEAYEVEFLSDDGNTVAVITLSPSQIRVVKSMQPLQ